MLNNKRLDKKIENLKTLRKLKREPLEDSRPTFTTTENDVSIEDQWKLFLKLCDVLYEKERWVNRNILEI